MFSFEDTIGTAPLDARLLLMLFNGHTVKLPMDNGEGQQKRTGEIDHNVAENTMNNEHFVIH